MGSVRRIAGKSWPEKSVFVSQFPSLSLAWSEDKVVLDITRGTGEDQVATAIMVVQATTLVIGNYGNGRPDNNGNHGGSGYNPGGGGHYNGGRPDNNNGNHGGSGYNPGGGGGRPDNNGNHGGSGYNPGGNGNYGGGRPDNNG